MKFEVLNRYTGSVQFVAEIDDSENTTSIRLGLAVKWALKNMANLYGANLYGANLYGANLYGANLTRANLYEANLYGANLNEANLYEANLTRANLTRANLYEANLYGANLNEANLTRANLNEANLNEANLYGAKEAELQIARTRILPEGSLIGWKKCQGAVIVKLRIPEEAKRSSAFGRKCRAEFADVLEVFGAEFGVTKAHGPYTEYKVGQRITPDRFDENWQEECSGGIHFYITRAEAEAH